MAENRILHGELCRFLFVMAESAFQKIIRVRSADFAIIDETAYYETIYAGGR